MELSCYRKLQNECIVGPIIYSVKACVPVCDILCAYCRPTVFRSIVEYACPVWHPGLTKNCLKILNEYKNAV